MSRPTLSVGARLVLSCLAAGVLLISTPAVRSQSSTWTGGGASDAWSDALNWSGTAPTAGGSSALTFAGTTRLTPNDDLASYTATALTFDATAGAFVLGGNSLTLAGDVTQNSTNLQTISQPLAIDFTANRTINTAAGSLTVSGVISTVPGTTGRIVKTGAGTLTLAAPVATGNPNYTSGFTVLGGVLSVSNDTQLGQVTAFPLTPGYIVLNGGTLQFTGGTSLLNNRGVSVGPAGTGNTGFGTIDVATGLTISYNGIIANNTDATGTGTGGLIKTGAGTFVFGGTSTYSGPTLVQNGAVRTNNNNRIPPGVMTLGTASTSGKLIIGNAANTTAVLETLNGLLTGGTGAANFVVGGNAAATPHTLILNIPNATTDTFDGTIGGPGANENNLGVTKGTNASSPAGTLVLTGTNTYLGPTTINAGTLQFSTLGNLGNGTAITFGGGTLQYASGLATPPDISARTVTLTGTGTIDTNGNTVTFANPVGNAGAGGLTKAGAGTLTLANGNTYAGTTTVSGGTLKLAGASPVASTLIVAGIAPASTAVLDVTGVSGGFQVASGKTLAGHGSVVGPVTIASGGFVSPGTTGGTGVPAGTLSFANGLTVAGTYAWDLQTAGPSDSTFTGQSTTGGGVHDALAVTGTLDLTQATLTLNSLGAAGATTFNSSSPYSWRIATANTVNGLPTISPTLTGNDFTGVPANSFSVASSGGVLFLNYNPTPVPEPGCVLAVTAAAAGLGWWRKRRSVPSIQ